MGRILAGGVLSRPFERWPTAFDDPFWRSYPYLLPCLFATSFAAFCFIVALVFLKEVSNRTVVNRLTAG
jgi:hypothetical protein